MYLKNQELLSIIIWFEIDRKILKIRPHDEVPNSTLLNLNYYQLNPNIINHTNEY